MNPNNYVTVVLDLRVPEDRMVWAIIVDENDKVLDNRRFGLRTFGSTAERWASFRATARALLRL